MEKLVCDRYGGMEGCSLESVKINKTMDFNDLLREDAIPIVQELNELIREMQRKKLRVSSWFSDFDLSASPDSFNMLNRGYGYQSLPGAADDVKFPWFKYWEVVWVVLNNEFRSGEKVLDLGGSSSLFSYYLASKGLDVTTIDIQKKLVDNANFVARHTGWKLRNLVMDMNFMAVQSMRALEIFLEAPFDHITSLCVYEHVARDSRIALNRKIKGLLVDGGKFSITFDYQNPDRTARIVSPQDVHEQFVDPSGLKVRGQDFYDNGKRYLLHPFYYNNPFKRVFWRRKASYIMRGIFPPWEILKTKNRNDFTFGALFLEKS